MKKQHEFEFRKLLATFFLLYISTQAYSVPIGHAPWVGETLSGVACRGDAENFGPYDYMLRQQLPSELHIVESYHFKPDVEQLIVGPGKTENYIPANLDYTLRAWPNHHRALNSISRYRINNLKKRSSGRYPPAECYLQRAINFSPRDPTAHMLYAIFLQRTNQNDAALEEYRIAEELDPVSVQVKYNLGLLLVELGKYDEALRYAQDVYTSEFPLPGLKQKLKRAGRWQEPTDSAEESPPVTP